MNQANTEAIPLLREAASSLRGMLEDERFIQETPLEVDAAMQIALDRVEQAIRRLEGEKG